MIYIYTGVDILKYGISHDSDTLTLALGSSQCYFMQAIITTRFKNIQIVHAGLYIGLLLLST